MDPLPMLGVRAEARDRRVDGHLERRGFAIDGNSPTFGHQVIGDGGANLINLASYEPVELYAVNTPVKGLCNAYTHFVCRSPSHGVSLHDRCRNW